MPAVSKLPFRKKEKEQIQPNSLLEDLFTKHSLVELNAMLTERPDDASLLAWNVNLRDYRAIVQRAIELVRED